MTACPAAMNLQMQYTANNCGLDVFWVHSWLMYDLKGVASAEWNGLLPENVPEPPSTMHRSSATDRQKFLSRFSSVESIP